MSKQTFSLLLSATLLCIILPSVASAAFTWTGPTATAPNENTPPPINVDASAQYKQGGLSVGRSDVNDLTGGITLFSPISKFLTLFAQTLSLSGTGTAGETVFSATGNASVSGTVNANRVISTTGLTVGPSTAPQRSAVYLFSPTGAKGLGFGGSNLGFLLEQPGDTRYLRFRLLDARSDEILRITDTAKVLAPIKTSPAGPPYNLQGDFCIDANANGAVDVGEKCLSNVNSSSGWALVGNAGTDPATNFVGTTDNQPLVFRTNNVENMRIGTNGNIGIGTAAPAYKLDAPGTTGTARLGSALVGSWPFSTGYALFGTSALDQTTSPANYALIQHPTGRTYLNAASGQRIDFRIGNTDAVSLTSAKNFGIGVINPVQKLEVAGKVYATGAGSDVCYDLNNDGTPDKCLSTINNNTYTAGSGINITGNTISNTAQNATHTGDATGATALRVVALQGVGVSPTAPTTNKVLKYNGSAWAPGSDSDTLASLVCSATGQIPIWGGSSWACQNNNATGGDNWGTQVAKTDGITIAGDGGTTATQLIANNSLALWNANTLQGKPISSVAGDLPSSNGQVLKWDGTNSRWKAGADSIGNSNITTCPNGQILKYYTSPAPTGKVVGWNCDIDTGTTYTAGAGINITGTTITNTSPNLPHTGDVTDTSGVLKVVKLQGNSVSATTPGPGQVLKWDGSAWKPDTDNSGTGGLTGGGTAGNLAVWSGPTSLTERTLLNVGATVNGVGRSLSIEDIGDTPALYWNSGTPSVKKFHLAYTGNSFDLTRSGVSVPINIIDGGTTQLNDASIKLTAIPGTGGLIRIATDGALSKGSVTNADLPASACPPGQMATGLGTSGVTCVPVPATGWLLTGNAGTNNGAQWLGTTDAQPLVLKTGGVDRLRILSGGNVGIGTTNPTQKFHVVGNSLLDGRVGVNIAPSTGADQALLSVGNGAGTAGVTNRISLHNNEYGFGVSFGSLDYVVPSTGKQNFYVGGTKTLTVANGKVGINVAGPANALDVGGVLRTTGSMIVNKVPGDTSPNNGQIYFPDIALVGPLAADLSGHLPIVSNNAGQLKRASFQCPTGSYLKGWDNSGLICEKTAQVVGVVPAILNHDYDTGPDDCYLQFADSPAILAYEADSYTIRQCIDDSGVFAIDTAGEAVHGRMVQFLTSVAGRLAVPKCVIVDLNKDGKIDKLDFTYLGSQYPYTGSATFLLNCAIPPGA